MLGALVGVFAWFLRDRRRYQRILENKIANLLAVLTYNLLCYLIVVLPPASNGIPPAAFMRSTSVCYGFPVIGSTLVISGIALRLSLPQREKPLAGRT